MSEKIRLAVADGHQQKYGCAFLKSCGVKIEGYDTKHVKRRPKSNLEGIEIKVIRPQDMPTQVANGHFDLAITGEDWFIDHRHQFPNTPVKKMMNLPFGGVRVCAAVHNDLGVKNIGEFKELFAEGRMPFPYIRIAGEYVNIADQFSYSHHFHRYKVIPTSGSTEAYLPEDADMIIENSQTGRTLVENNLGVIEVLFKSTACIIANTDTLKNKKKKSLIIQFVSICEKGLKKSEQET
jgi:ATP phosphoribosyltransferase